MFDVDAQKIFFCSNNSGHCPKIPAFAQTFPYLCPKNFDFAEIFEIWRAIASPAGTAKWFSKFDQSLIYPKNAYGRAHTIVNNFQKGPTFIHN